MERGYAYGMRLRGFSPGAQPMGTFLDRMEDATGKYYDILIYSVPLKEETARQYDLDFLGRAATEWNIIHT